MKLSDIGTPIADWLLQSQGYDADSVRLTDRTGLEHHFPKTGGTVAFVTHGGIEGMNMNGMAFTADSFLPAAWTLVSVIHANLNAADAVSLIYGEPLAYSGNTGVPYTAGDPAWETPDTFGASYYTTGGKTLVASAHGAGLVAELGSSLVFGGVLDAAYAANAWQVVQVVLNPFTLVGKIRVNKGAIGVRAMASAQFTTINFERLSMGGAVLTTSGGEHFTMARAALFNDDLFAENLSGLNDLVDALIANPAAVGP